MNKIILRQLTEEFYNENTGLVEVMDKNYMTNEFDNKGRGYGVLLMDIYGLKFAIPLRSKMKHKENFVTQTEKDAQTGRVVSKKGLDYSKAVIIEKETHYSTRTFMIPAEEFQKIISSEERIKRQFMKYIEKYIKACERQDPHVLREYEKSTLKNYHVELNIAVSQEV